MRLSSGSVAVVVAALLFATCGVTDESVITPAPEGSGQKQPGEGAPKPADAPAEGTAGAGGGVRDDGALGSAGQALLSGEVSGAVVEVDTAEGASVAADPRAVVGDELRRHGQKKEVTARGASTVPHQPVYSAADLRRLVAEHRQVRSSPTAVAVYVLVLSGRYEDERVTGVAFAATSFAVFPDQIGGGLLGVNRAAYEQAVMVHELGHLFGLVNLTGEGGFHEDPDHKGHSGSRGSVMYWAVEDVSIRNIFSGGPPREFDDADRKEMAQIRR